MCIRDSSIAELQGGSLRNAIPREAWVVVTLPEEELSELEEMVKEFEALYIKEYKGIEEGIKMSVERLNETPAHIVPQEIADNVIQAVEAVQNLSLIHIYYILSHHHQHWNGDRTDTSNWYSFTLL